ncbi:hypothetical protein V5799_020513 [Amblyomma americanum]|uniref:Uncharacterized protein n=1 Tax=Amblyomma americanum TaxID=6943 RepID=A0AAQ4EU48_AMBAM
MYSVRLSAKERAACSHTALSLLLQSTDTCQEIAKVLTRRASPRSCGQLSKAPPIECVGKQRAAAALLTAPRLPPSLPGCCYLTARTCFEGKEAEWQGRLERPLPLPVEVGSRPLAHIAGRLWCLSVTAFR